MESDSTLLAAGKYLIFHVAKRAYAIPTKHVEEILPLAELFTVAGCPSFLAGFLDIGGQAVAVISINRLLQIPDFEPELFTPLVILKGHSVPLALQVEQVAHIAEVTPDMLVPLSDGTSLNNCAMAVARVDDQTVVLLSPERILLEQEHKRVAELTEIARHRLTEIETETV